jgi:DNA-binding CsgD family transcriptional regulator
MLPFGLTPRELEVIGLICEGAPNRDIGRILGISAETVKRHLLNIFNKTGQSSRLELALFAMSKGMAVPRSVTVDVQQVLDEIDTLKTTMSAQLQRLRIMVVQANRREESNEAVGMDIGTTDSELHSADDAADDRAADGSRL